MAIILPDYNLKVPSETTRFKDLGKELREMGVSFDVALRSFDYSGADPALVLTRVTALESWRVSATSLIAALEAANAKRKKGITTYFPGVIAPGSNGWQWSQPLTFTFPTPFPAGTVPVVTGLHAQEIDGLLSVTLVEPPTNSGFKYRVMRLGTPPTGGKLHWNAEI